MDQVQIDVYGVLAAILSLILTTVVPWLTFKYRRLLMIFRECRILLHLVSESWKDRTISREEIKLILDEASKIIDAAIGEKPNVANSSTNSSNS